MTLPILLILIVASVILFVSPQLAKFRATLGINKALDAGGLTLLQKVWLGLLGLKTPFLSTISLLWSFMLAEGDQLRGFAWDTIVSHEHAVWISFTLWIATLWSHFSGLQAAAATPPVVTPLPYAIPTPAPKG